MTLLDIIPKEDDRITPRQREFLEFIATYEKLHGYSPTFREISIGMDVASKGTVSVMVKKLVKSGMIERRDNAVRGLHVR
jgi:SOS-response transcriptional repressor LexA